MLKLQVTDPGRETEKEIIRKSAQATASTIESVATTEEILRAREEIASLYMDEKITDYIVDLVQATREPAEFGLAQIRPLIEYGASPRASIFLAACAKAHAFLDGRDYRSEDRRVGKDD